MVIVHIKSLGFFWLVGHLKKKKKKLLGRQGFGTLNSLRCQMNKNPCRPCQWPQTVSFSRANKVQRAHVFFSFVSMSDASHGLHFNLRFACFQCTKTPPISSPSLPPRSLFAAAVTHERARRAIGGLFVSFQRAANYNVWPRTLKRERRRRSGRARLQVCPPAS